MRAQVFREEILIDVFLWTKYLPIEYDLPYPRLI